MKQFTPLVVAFLLTIAVAGRTAAQENAPAAKASVPGFRGEFLAQLVDVEKKFVDLAGAIPAEKYSWRPGEGVRSFSEVCMHVVGANFRYPSFVGIKPPDTLQRDLEKKVTAKDDVISYLKASFAFIRQAALATADADLDKQTKSFEGETSYRGAFLEAANHMHEHLGQSIAYTRMLGIVPPWTAAEQQSRSNGKK